MRQVAAEKQIDYILLPRKLTWRGSAPAVRLDNRSWLVRLDGGAGLAAAAGAAGAATDGAAEKSPKSVLLVLKHIHTSSVTLQC